MTKTKTNRIFLGIVTVCLALAGTGLTLANNAAWDVQIMAVALTLATCFTAAEVSFLWGHKVYEKTKKLWRKITLTVALVALVGAMTFAVYEELKLALHKLSNNALAGSSALIIKSADVKNQRSLGRTALQAIAGDKVKIDPLPFVICYGITALVSIVILAVEEKKVERKIRGAVPITEEMAQQIKDKLKIDPAGAKVYAQDSGYVVYANGKYTGHVPKQPIGFNQP